MRNLLIVLGVPIDNLTMDETIDRLDEFVTIGRTTGRTHQVATVNADFVVNSLHDPELRHILQEADMATADGMPLVWGARLLGTHLHGRVTGADIVPALATRAAQKGYSVYFLGAKPGIAQRAAEILLQRNPGLRIAGVDSPAPASVLAMDRGVMEAVKQAKPDILLVAFGNPKQEKWIGMYARELQIPVCIGIGGTLDFIAGVTRRAPSWMQRIGLEWVYRLLQEPKRLFKRYVHDLTYFSYFFARQWWQMRRGATRPPPLPNIRAVRIDETAVLPVVGRLDITNQAAFLEQGNRVLASTPFIVIDLSSATFLDSSALGALVFLANQARAVGGGLRLAGVPPQVARVLTTVRLDHFFEIYPDVPNALTRRYMPAAPVEPAPSLAGWAVVKLPRLVDAGSAPTILQQCQHILDNNPCLILDLKETTLLASSGLAALVKLDRQAQQCGGELRIANCSREVLRSLQLVRLDTVFHLFNTVEGAAVQTVDPLRSVAAGGAVTLPLAKH